ncbi:Leucine-rich repeat-containing protein 42 [Merluccius polli]|uniref:Leucine-rich repeat-containing protein 42 n=1 Tax=Merluccius polli TaxID=89951 RepID=A0AA47P3E2_MERPO|nr:Leucine-rich repeat-containing protein 42 [Merluccius polli]
MCSPDHDNNGAALYIREAGQLRRVNDIVLAEVSSSSSSSSCRRTKPLPLPLLLKKREHFVFAYNARGHLRYSPRSLFDLTLRFVAQNVHRVDSLRHFPEQIGAQLFAAAEEEVCVFSDQETGPRALRVFNDAYGDTVLTSLCLRNRFPLLSERMCEIKTFHSLKCLDLFGCRLGDSHEIFQHLTNSPLTGSLVKLFIGGNCLSDIGLQRLTAPVRMFKKGLDNLQLLDLSGQLLSSCPPIISAFKVQNLYVKNNSITCNNHWCTAVTGCFLFTDNPISEKVVRYLTCLPNLQHLDVSGTNFKLGTGLRKTMYDLTGLVCSGKPLDVFDHSRCKTEGWAEHVVNWWETIASQVPKLKKIKDSRKSALRFFGRQKFISDVLNAMPVVRHDEDEDKTEKLHFYKPAPKHGTPEVKVNDRAEDSLKPSCHNARKRHRQSEDSETRRSPPGKRFSSSTLTAADIDLLDSY